MFKFEIKFSYETARNSVISRPSCEVELESFDDEVFAFRMSVEKTLTIDSLNQVFSIQIEKQILSTKRLNANQITCLKCLISY